MQNREEERICVCVCVNHDDYIIIFILTATESNKSSLIITINDYDDDYRNDEYDK